MEINNLEQFKEFVNTTDVVLVSFYSTWCPPCRMLKPIIEEYIENNEDKKIFFINTDDLKEISSAYGIYNVPTLCWFKNGEIVDTLSGYVEYEEIDDVFLALA